MKKNKFYSFWTEFTQVNSRGAVIDKQLIKMVLQSEDNKSALDKLEFILRKIPRKRVIVPSKTQKS